jgi:hypothetical protein
MDDMLANSITSKQADHRSIMFWHKGELKDDESGNFQDFSKSRLF